MEAQPTLARTTFQLIQPFNNRLCALRVLTMVAMSCCTSNAYAIWSGAAVYPTGSFPLDVQNVQTAIDGGGAIVLKATDANGQPTAFNFGPADPSGGGVNITTNVRIRGERTGQHATTINGGYIPILCANPVKSLIANIDFEGPLAAAIMLTSSNGTDIIGNQIDDVVGISLPVGFTDGDGIDLFGGDNGPQSDDHRSSDDLGQHDSEFDCRVRQRCAVR